MSYLKIFSYCTLFAIHFCAINISQAQDYSGIILSAIQNLEQHRKSNYKYTFRQETDKDTITLVNKGLHHFSEKPHSFIYPNVKSFYNEIIISDKYYKNRKFGIYAEKGISRQVDKTFNSDISFSGIKNTSQYYKYPIGWMLYPLFFNDKSSMINASFFEELLNEPADTFQKPYITQFESKRIKTSSKKPSYNLFIHICFNDHDTIRIQNKWGGKIHPKLLKELTNYKFNFTINTTNNIPIGFEVINKKRRIKQTFTLSSLQAFGNTDDELFFTRLSKRFPELKMPKCHKTLSNGKLKTSLCGSGNSLLRLNIPDFIEKTHLGSFFHLSKAQTKYVLLLYWNSEHLNNMSRIDHIIKILSKHPDLFTIIGINTHAESIELITEIHKKMKWNFESIPSLIIPTQNCYKDQTPAISLVKTKPKLTTICAICEKPDKDILFFLKKELGLK